MSTIEKKSVVFILPMSKTLDQLKTALMQNADAEGLDLLDCQNYEEALQVVPTVAPALLISSDPRTVAQFLNSGKKNIKSGQNKTILISDKKLPLKAMQKLDKLGLTDHIIEPIAAKSLLYKIKIQIRALPSKKVAEELALKSSDKNQSNENQDPENKVKNLNNNSSTSADREQSKNHQESEDKNNNFDEKNLLKDLSQPKTTSSKLQLFDEENNDEENNDEENENENKNFEQTKTAIKNAENKKQKNNLAQEQEDLYSFKKKKNDNQIDGNLEGKGSKADELDGQMEGKGAKADHLEGYLKGKGAKADELDGQMEGKGVKADHLEGYLKGKGAKADQIDGQMEGKGSKADQLDGQMEGEGTKADQLEGYLKGKGTKADQLKGPMEGKGTKADQLKGTMGGAGAQADQLDGPMAGNGTAADQHKGPMAGKGTKADQLDGPMTGKGTKADQLDGQLEGAGQSSENPAKKKKAQNQSESLNQYLKKNKTANSNSPNEATDLLADLQSENGEMNSSASPDHSDLLMDDLSLENGAASENQENPSGDQNQNARSLLEGLGSNDDENKLGYSLNSKNNSPSTPDAKSKKEKKIDWDKLEIELVAKKEKNINWEDQGPSDPNTNTTEPEFFESAVENPAIPLETDDQFWGRFQSEDNDDEQSNDDTNYQFNAEITLDEKAFDKPKAELAAPLPKTDGELKPIEKENPVDKNDPQSILNNETFLSLLEDQQDQQDEDDENSPENSHNKKKKKPEDPQTIGPTPLEVLFKKQEASKEKLDQLIENFEITSDLDPVSLELQNDLNFKTLIAEAKSLDFTEELTSYQNDHITEDQIHPLENQKKSPSEINNLSDLFFQSETLSLEFIIRAAITHFQNKLDLNSYIEVLQYFAQSLNQEFSVKSNFFVLDENKNYPIFFNGYLDLPSTIEAYDRVENWRKIYSINYQFWSSVDIPTETAQGEYVYPYFFAGEKVGYAVMFFENQNHLLKINKMIPYLELGLGVITTIAKTPLKDHDREKTDILKARIIKDRPVLVKLFNRWMNAS